MSQIGTRIKELRIKKGISEEELAKKAGYKSAAIIKAIESGAKKPSFDKNLDIAKALGVSINELLGNRKGLTVNEKKVLGGIHGYVDNLPDEDIELGVKVFRLIYDAYLGRRAKEELNRIQDRLTLEAHKEKYPYKGDIRIEDDSSSGDASFNPEKELKKIKHSGEEKYCRINIRSEGETYFVAVYINKTLVAKEEGDCWDNNSGVVAVTLLNNIFETVPETLSCQEISVYTDSEYLRKGINLWASKWEKNGWKTAGGSKQIGRAHV